MSLTTPLSVQKLQTALHDKAKGSPRFRFYALYDKVYREDVMAFAYECCKANRGAAGVDGQTFEDIEYSPRRPFKVGGSTDRRRSDAAFDQDVAGSSGRRDRRERE